MNLNDNVARPGSDVSNLLIRLEGDLRRIADEVATHDTPSPPCPEAIAALERIAWRDYQDAMWG